MPIAGRLCVYASLLLIAQVTKANASGVELASGAGAHAWAAYVKGSGF